MKKHARTVAAAMGIALIAYAAFATVLHHFFPLPVPGPEAWPRPGDVFFSETEGVRQTVLSVEGDHMSVELEFLPRAPGPPSLHYHETFSEVIVIAEGHLGLELEGEQRTLGPGDVYPVTPGVVHRIFNAGDERVVIRGEQVSVPAIFGTCLAQLYAINDDLGMTLNALLHISLLQGICDIHLAGSAGFVQRPLLTLLEPIARALGYRTIYKVSKSPRSARRRA